MLASVFRHTGILPRSDTRGGEVPGSPGRGSLLCQAYEIYRSEFPSPMISFEHAEFLLRALWRGDELALGACRECRRVLVTDRWIMRAPRCGVCSSAPP